MCSSDLAVPGPAPAIEARFDRSFLHAVIPLPAGRPLHVLNLHLKSPLAAAIPGQKRSALAWNSVGGWAEGFFLSALKRAGQALEVRLLVERIFDAEPDAMIAVCGIGRPSGRRNSATTAYQSASPPTVAAAANAAT